MKGTRLYRKVEVYYLPWTLLFYFWFPKHNFMLNTLRIKVSTDHIPSLTKLQLQNRIEQMDSTYTARISIQCWTHKWMWTVLLQFISISRMRNFTFDRMKSPSHLIQSTKSECTTAFKTWKERNKSVNMTCGLNTNIFLKLNGSKMIITDV